MAPAVASSLKGASILVLLQVGSRALTFALNQSLLRFLSPEIMGVYAQLELFTISILFFARESLRVALQRQTSSLQSIVNIAYVPFLLSIPLTLVFRQLYLQSSSLPDVPLMRLALDVQAVATVIEVLVEPAFAVSQQKMLYSIRASAETLATVARCIITFAVFAYAQHHSIAAGALPFALGQLSYAVVLLGVYTIRSLPIATADGFALTPRPIATKDHFAGYLSRPLFTLGLYLYVQSGLKYVLTQGDAIIVTAFTTLGEQGAYALASNYGGLIARLLFQPIEESSRNLFAKLCGPAPGQTRPLPANLTQAIATLQIILKFYALLALLAWTLGPSTAPLLLRIVAGSRWAGTGADAVLGTYCFLIPLLALNGITEAFVAAVASHEALRRQSVLMSASFVAFAGAAWVLLRVLGLGAQGLVLANCVNMACRIVWNTHFTRSFFQGHGQAFRVREALPSGLSIAAAVGVAGVIARLQAPVSLPGVLLQKAALGVGLLAAMAVGERAFLLHCWRLVRPTTPVPDDARSKKAQ